MTTKAHRGLQDKGGKWLGSSQEPLEEETRGQDRRTQLCTEEDGALGTGETRSSCVCAHACVLGGHSRKSISWGYVPGVPSLVRQIVRDIPTHLGLNRFNLIVKKF